MSVIADGGVTVRAGQKVFDGNRIGEVARLDGDAVILDSGERMPMARVAEVALPLVGAPVFVPAFGSAFWVGPSRVEGEQLVGLLLSGDEVYERHVDPSTLRAEEGDSLDERTCVLLTALHERHRAWKRNLTDAAHEYANDNELCEVFDNFMVSFGLEPRTREYEARITITFNVLRDGTSFDDAFDGLSHEQVRDLFQDNAIDFNYDWEQD